ncbi:HSP70-interacting protein, putative [Entamoeba invadens IP1]|uniref:HSP70-interacting protein, putative n=2 Tax=Entamoeba invadens TaxID=33085 RepID=A0A0A1UBV8_ENTIV|nr:HSP70-interacting protein, putative [Entamoeba invadens IP1]ELP92696.1 HSP70-interacting protein, putative [Entamoeba invadens IP1]BAN41412.1 HSP70-interacting protein, putative [Entamoeba invadens]|eukprot:XP_004259467.1 HSP70-interacting protein, putative [Entamoeba invadens IP1]
MESPLYRQFLVNLEKKGFFANCSETQKEMKIEKAKTYFNTHYTGTNSVVTHAPAETVDPAKFKEAEEHKMKGNEHLAKKEFAKAIDEYSKAIALCKDPIFYGNRAAAYTAIGEDLLAIDDANMSIKMNPNYAKGYGRLSIVLSKRKDYEKALKAIDTAIALEPNDQLFKQNRQHLLEIIAKETPSQDSLKKEEKEVKPLNTKSEKEENKEIKIEEKEMKETTETKENKDIPIQERLPNGIGQDGPRTPPQQQPQPNLFNMFGGMGMPQGGMPNVQGLESLFTGNSQLMDMARGFMNNPAMRPMLNMVAQSMGITVEQLQQSIDEQNREGQNQGNTTGQNRNQQNQRRQDPPPGYL